MMGDLESVRVALRVRPLVPSEEARGCQIAVEKVDGANQVLVNNTDAFSFNFVFDWRDTQEEVYNVSVCDMLDKLFYGFNATILAYGQTGSGKTHTMGTAFDGSLDENVGVIPRAMHDIFERVKQLDNEYDFVIKCSFMELYQEQLYDLLSEKSREESVIDMREDRNGILMVGLTEIPVSSAKETTDSLVKGSAGRAVASTAMNSQSSRSHAIFTVTLQATKKDESRAVTTSKFHLVDLAGSERSKKTGATGDRFKEGVKINQGLLALGNVISALGDGKGAGFVRYRDSKLTRLLQDSLGGNSVTLMIACVSPADYNVAETLSTLRYADRARKIKNKPIINQDPHAAEINRLKGIIQKLRVELLTKGGTMTSSLTCDLEAVESVAPLASVSISQVMSSEEQGRKYKQLQEKYKILHQQWQMTLHDVTEHQMRAHIAEEAHENLKQKAAEMKSYVSELLKIKETPLDEEKIININQKISKLLEGFDDELCRAEREIMDHKRSMGSSITADDEPGEEEDSGTNISEMHTIIQEHTEAFTNKQMKINDQLRRINRELNIKEQLQQAITGNFSKFSTLDDDIEERVKECEQRIQELEAEKLELLDKLRHVRDNASAKLAEERRKRLQVLEHEISEMKRKNIQQANLIKIRERETQKIQNIKNEIQAMKESKVKLIRAMRCEAEKFRQFKMMREKEVIQLKNKDRKMQNEMARKEALHNKQRNVLKRKCEEAMAINKRLKDALERQKNAQIQRQKMQSTKGATAASVKNEQFIIACVERELEVIISLIDAERTLDQLMDDRGIINSRLGELQQQQPHPDPLSEAGREIANLQEEIEMRNAQISDLQQRVCAHDVDMLIKSLSDSTQSAAEARSVVKYLVKTLVDMRREHSQLSEELRSQIHLVEEKSNDAAKIIQQMKFEHEQAIAEYEEKISLALTPEQGQQLKLQEEQEKKIESLMIELENYKQMRENSTNNKKRGKTSAKNIFSNNTETMEKGIIEIEEFTESEEDMDISENDPDWIKTPQVRRRVNNKRHGTSQNSQRSISQSDISQSMDVEGRPQQQVTISTTYAGPSGQTANTSRKSKHQRKSKGCQCRGDCRRKRCGCNSINQKCTVNCGCTDICRNRQTPSPSANNGSDEEKTKNVIDEEIDLNSDSSSTENQFKSPININTYTSKAVEVEHLLPEDKSNRLSYYTPKAARLSNLNFDTNTAKKKFFNN